MAFQRVIADVRQPGADVWGPEPFVFEFEKLFHRYTKSISEMFIKIYRKEGCIIPYFCFCILLGNIL